VAAEAAAELVDDTLVVRHPDTVATLPFGKVTREG